MSAMDDLNDVITGVSGDIYKADQCISIIDQIADQSERLNYQGFGDLFGSLQGYLREHMILAITNIFERPNDRYPTISLPTAIQLLMENADTLAITEPVILRCDLVKLGVSADYLNGLEQPDITLLVARTLRDTMPNPETTEKLANTEAALRTARNKRIAHHEAISVEELPAATWGEIPPLLDVAKQSLGIIGSAYLSTAYTVDDGSYPLTGDAERAGRALNRLFREAGLIPDEP